MLVCPVCHKTIENAAIMPKPSKENVAKGIDWTRLHHLKCLEKVK